MGSLRYSLLGSGGIQTLIPGRSGVIQRGLRGTGQTETAWKLAPHSTAPHSTLTITKQYCAAQFTFIMNIIIKSQLRRLIQCGHPHVECKKGNAKLMTALRTVAMSFVGQ